MRFIYNFSLSRQDRPWTFRIWSRLPVRLITLLIGMLLLLSQASMFKGEALDTAANIMAWVVLVIAPIIGITVFWLVHILPKKAVADNERVLELTQTSYRVGNADLRAMQQQMISLQSAREARLRVESKRLSQRTTLHLALGGSFEPVPVETGEPVAQATPVE